jgi:hypothetical protein
MFTFTLFPQNSNQGSPIIALLLFLIVFIIFVIIGLFQWIYNTIAWLFGYRTKSTSTKSVSSLSTSSATPIATPMTTPGK